jgi:hypothetical protein
LKDAEREFKDAEAELREAMGPDSVPFPYSCLQYCELLLDLGRYEEVCERAEWVVGITDNGRPGEVGLGHAAWGCACMLQDAGKGGAAFTEGRKHIDYACEQLRRADEQEFLPIGYVARAQYRRLVARHGERGDQLDDARRDLDKALFLSTRGEMGLCEADVHLEYARHAMAEAILRSRSDGDCCDMSAAAQNARMHLTEVAQLVEKMGYRRRVPEIELETARLLILEGDHAGARDRLAKAEELIRQMGCERWAPVAAELRNYVTDEPE